MAIRSSRSRAHCMVMVSLPRDLSVRMFVVEIIIARGHRLDHNSLGEPSDGSGILRIAGHLAGICRHFCLLELVETPIRRFPFCSGTRTATLPQTSVVSWNMRHARQCTSSKIILSMLKKSPSAATFSTWRPASSWTFFFTTAQF